MRILNFVALLLLPAWAVAAPVSLSDGAMTFDAPDNFSALPRAEIADIFARGNPPSAVYANTDRRVSIAVTFSQGKVEPDELPKLKTDMEAALSAQPDLQWLKRELTVSNDTRWVHFEFTTTLDGDLVHNDLYLTSFRGRMLGISFNAKSAAYAGYKQALEESFRSVQLHE